MQPLVSIIIPVYNAEKYLEKSIHSALNQTWPNKEIIIVDDGSQDKSLDIAKKFESDIVHVYSQNTKNAAKARNQGIRLSKGSYIQFLDADDYLSTDKLSSQLDILKDNPGCLGLCRTVYFKEDEIPDSGIETAHGWLGNGTDNPLDFLLQLYGDTDASGGMIQPNAWLTPREIIQEAGWWNEELTLDDDGEFFCRIILASKGIRYSKQGANFYRKLTTGSLSGRKNKASYESLLNSTHCKTTYLLSKSNTEAVRNTCSRLFWNVCIEMYPKFPDLAKQAERSALNLSPRPPKDYYTHTKLYKIITRYFGWKVSAKLSFIKHKFL